MRKLLFLLGFISLLSTNLYADAPISASRNNSDQALSEAQQNQALTITFGHTGFEEISLSLANGTSKWHSVADTLDADHMLKAVSFRSTQNVTVQLTGTSINPLTDGNTASFTARAGIIYNLELINISRIDVTNGSGSAMTGEILIYTTRRRS